MDNTETINVLSLCTGYGGLELGLAGALENPLRVVAVEIEAYALANLAAKAQEGKLAIEAMWPDLKTFPAKRFRGCFDFILAGYPCQPFSIAGKRKGKDDPRHLWPHIARIVQAVRPVWCFFENVPGHLTLGFPEVYRSLRDMGYSVETGLFTAAEVGAPHKRQRLFILAKSGKCNREWGTARPGRRVGQQSQIGESWRFGQAKGSCNKWPARPGQTQYEWEEPRTTVLVYNALQRRYFGKNKKIQARRNCAKQASKGQAQSRLGGAVNGSSSRVDRLRLLGNGVVPQQAEKAFRELLQ